MEELNKLFLLLASGQKANINLAKEFARFIIVPNQPTTEEYFKRFKHEYRDYINYPEYSLANLQLKAEDRHQRDILDQAPEWFDASDELRWGANIHKQWFTFDNFVGRNQLAFYKIS